MFPAAMNRYIGKQGVLKKEKGRVSECRTIELSKQRKKIKKKYRLTQSGNGPGPGVGPGAGPGAGDAPQHSGEHGAPRSGSTLT